MAVRIVCFLLSVRFMNFCVGILLHLLFFPRLLSQMHTFMCQRRPGKFCLLSVTINDYMDFCLKSNRQNKTECTVFVHSAIKCTNLLIYYHLFWYILSITNSNQSQNNKLFSRRWNSIIFRNFKINIICFFITLRYYFFNKYILTKR